MEKAKGLEVCTRLRNDRGGKPKLKILESGSDDDSESFWGALGGKGMITSADEGGCDAAEEKKAKAQDKAIESKSTKRKATTSNSTT